ncbi:MAG TPA: hypothetical protein VF573_01280 [Paraburkholderia sp.]|uniref:hypothetical protein n=1 Tax=Paraburkholderia sp. TaxID=1926495 RepID=UPI002ED07E95
MANEFVLPDLSELAEDIVQIVGSDPEAAEVYYAERLMLALSAAVQHVIGDKFAVAEIARQIGRDAEDIQKILSGEDGDLARLIAVVAPILSLSRAKLRISVVPSDAGHAQGAIYKQSAAWDI